MQYGKPVLSVADSVLRLKNKGLTVTDDADAERFLRAIGYFRFRGYALPFMQSAPAGFLYGNRQFKPGTTFDEIRQTYEFDRALRSLVMDQIDRIEVAVRTAILQELNTHFGTHWYLDWLHSLNNLRNACAHHGRIWNRSLPFNPRSHPQYLAHFSHPSRFYSRAAVIRIMTTAIDGNAFFSDGLRYLFHSHPTINPAQMGFVPDWDRDPLWT